MTDCTCQPEDYPFFCERHQCRKTAHWLHLCRTRDDYFQMWEAGRGPGQSVGKKRKAARPRNPADKVPCRHQGTLLRTEVCSTCRGHVRLKVFACGIYGECTLMKTLNRQTACCAICKDYLPVAPLPDTNHAGPSSSKAGQPAERPEATRPPEGNRHS